MPAEVMEKSKAVANLDDSQRDTEKETPNDEANLDHSHHDTEEEESPTDDSDDSDCDSDEKQRLNEEFRKYREDLDKYEGFLIENFPSVSFFGAIWPADLDGKEYEYVQELTQSAIDKHNSENGMDLKLLGIKRAYRRISSVSIYYITFDAIDSSSSDEKKTYQTELHCFVGWEMQVKKFRLQREDVPV